MIGENYLESIGQLFYILSPNRTTFKSIDEVPDYVEKASPNLLAMFFIEICVSMYTRRSKIKLNDTIANLSQGILMETAFIFSPAGHLMAYNYIYENWRIMNLNWDSLWTWWLCFLLFDLVYYVGHRAAHEINLLWATHHIHHSSEEYNISTNFRQSILQHFIHIRLIEFAIAFFVPVPIYFAHAQFSYLYQFWIHTKQIKTLGPLEYILNTPSHHRVHHGRNKKCIDKNFAGTLIIWDRLFGTFESEEGEEIHYGLTHPINSFDLWKIQFDHIIHIMKMLWNYKGIENKLSVLFKGPGWSPGKPRLGYIEDVPEIKNPVQKYDLVLPLWIKIYAVCHFLIVVQGHLELMKTNESMPQMLFYGLVIFETFSLINIGLLLDKRSCFPKLELIRCTLYFLMDYYFRQSISISITSLQSRWFPEMLIQLSYWASFFIWFACCSKDAAITKFSILIQKIT